MTTHPARVRGSISLTGQLVALLDEAFVGSIPAAPQLLRLLEERGWVGWTDIHRA